MSNFRKSEFQIASIFCVALFILFVVYNTGLFPFNNWIVNIYENNPTIITIILSCLQPIIFSHYLVKVSFFFFFSFSFLYKFILLLGLFNLFINAFFLPSEQMSLKRFIICFGLFQIPITVSIIGKEFCVPFELIYFYSYISVLLNMQMWYIYFFLYRFFGVDEKSTEFATGTPLRLNDLVDLYYTNKIYFLITVFPLFLNIIIFSKLFRIFEKFVYNDIFCGMFVLAVFFMPIIYYFNVIKLIDFRTNNHRRKRFLLSFKNCDFILGFNFFILLVLFFITIISFFFFDNILDFIKYQHFATTFYPFSYRI
jgi:hypothetical protein